MLSNTYTIGQIKAIIGAGGSLKHHTPILNLLTDSRKISNPQASLFFALEGRRDGHSFIAEVYNAGVRAFIVSASAKLDIAAFADADFLTVPDVLAALQTLAAHHRAAFGYDVIGITGSNGKTIVKEWLYQLLSADKIIVRNPKSFNSQLGVPLSVWQMDERYNLGIFEAGISTVNEMEKLEAIIKPNIGILTHIGSAHNEGFSSGEQKLTEKLRLFKDSRLTIYQYDTLLAYHSALPGHARFTWSKKHPEANLYIYSSNAIAGKYHLKAKYKGEDIPCTVPFTDEASIENAITCWATMLALGYDNATIHRRIEHLSPVSMRMELKQGINNCSVIDDSYNSDIQSLEIALNFLNQQNQHQSRTLILSDIYQSGLEPAVLYQQVAALLSEKKVDKLIGIGKAISANQDAFAVGQKYFYPDTQSFLKQITALGFANETILIKGSRSFAFEQISKVLSQKAHETVMEINLNAMQHNLNYYRAQLQPGVKLMAMVKAFSYGSGSFEVANLLQFNKVDYLAVAYIDEGVALRNAGIKLPIMVLSPEISAFEKLAAFDLEPEIYSFALLAEYQNFNRFKGISTYPVHLKIDTGMHRMGFEAHEIAQLCNLLKNNLYINVRSVFSHLAASDAHMHDDFTKQQLSCFEEACQQIEVALGHKVIKHIANTSGISRWPGAQFDMVRLGIGLYGVDGAFSGTDSPLQAVAALKTSIAQIKTVHAADTIGYNRKGNLPHGGKIATVRIGYADGYIRAFGNGTGKMIVNGARVPTIGNISMDACAIDITGVEVDEGDEVIVFNEELKIEELASQIGTIPYEILTNVSARVKRVYFYE